MGIFYGTNPLAYGNDGTNNNGNVYRIDHVVPLDDNLAQWADSVSYYNYDALNRIISVDELPIASWVNVNGGWLPQSYAQKYKYDRWGNRQLNTAATWGIGINRKDFAVNTGNNRLEMPTGNSCSGAPNGMCYDAAGNLTFDNYTNTTSQSYQYDAENRLKQATVTSSTNTYSYDGSGQRVKRMVWENGVLMLKEYWQIYGLGGELLAEYNVASGVPNLQKEHAYRNGQLLVVYDATETGTNNGNGW